MRAIYPNILGPDGKQLPVDTPIAVVMYSDATEDQRPYHGGILKENGRLYFLFDGPDPPNGTGVNIFVQAVPACAQWLGRGELHGTEWIPDPRNSPDGAFSPDGLSILLKEGTSPFRSTPPVPPFIEAVPRGPLPPFDTLTYDPETGAPLPVATVLPFTPPPLRTPRFRREQFCGLTVRDLPNVSGAGDPTCVFMPHLDRYSVEHQSRILEQTATSGYEWVTLSWPDSRSVGHSLSQFVADAVRIKKFNNFYLDHMMFSKVYDPHNPDPHSVHDVLHALLDAGAIDACTIAWEMNAFVDPEWVTPLTDGVVSVLPPEVLRYYHFLPHYASWQANQNDSPTAFWERAKGKITGLKYQCEPPGVTSVNTPYWSAGMCQARLNDVLDRLVQHGIWNLSWSVDVIAWETTAQTRFNHGTDEFGTLINEDQQDLRGYETLCSPGRMTVQGYGNGARQPNGHQL
jgi:hypothetical protein